MFTLVKCWNENMLLPRKKNLGDIRAVNIFFNNLIIIFNKKFQVVLEYALVVPKLRLNLCFLYATSWYLKIQLKFR